MTTELVYFTVLLLFLKVTFYLIAKDVYKWLAAPETSKNFNDAKSKRGTDTCVWLLEKEEFDMWKNSSGIFWVKGTGKQSCL